MFLYPQWLCFDFKGLNPQVQKYLEDHLLKSLAPRNRLLAVPTTKTPRGIRRKMSCKGAIKKTRSINVERKLELSCIIFLVLLHYYMLWLTFVADILGMQSEERKFSVYMQPPLSELDINDARSPSPDDLEPAWKHQPGTRHRYYLSPMQSF